MCLGDFKSNDFTSLMIFPCSVKTVGMKWNSSYKINNNLQSREAHEQIDKGNIIKGETKKNAEEMNKYRINRRTRNWF